jgi:hypothetical protein
VVETRMAGSDMTFFWFLFSACTLSAGLVGYGIGYLNGIKDAITANVVDGEPGLRED